LREEQAHQQGGQPAPPRFSGKRVPFSEEAVFSGKNKVFKKKGIKI
jgi:hypothetical protein